MRMPVMAHRDETKEEEAHHLDEECRHLLVGYVADSLHAERFAGSEFETSGDQHLLVQPRERCAAHLLLRVGRISVK